MSGAFFSSRWYEVCVPCCFCGFKTLFVAQTSKKFKQDVGGYRFVWLRILQDMTERGCLLPNSFPLETMTTQDIRSCVTRPLRMRSAIFSDQNFLLLSQHFRFNHGHVSVVNENPRLLPGGRWIITTSFDGIFSYVSCWDIRHVRKGNELRPVAQRKVKQAGQLINTCMQYDPETLGVNMLLRTVHRHGHFQFYQLKELIIV